MISMLDWNASSSGSLLETIVSPDGRREDGAVSISYDKTNNLLWLGLNYAEMELPMASGIKNLRQKHHHHAENFSKKEMNFDHFHGLKGFLK